MPEIHYLPAANRFVAEVDGGSCYVEYTRGDGVLTITHTIVPAMIGGRGIASALVDAVMRHARAEGLRVAPRCSYARVWMQRHPEYDDLRA